MLVNLTPHPLTIHPATGDQRPILLPPSGQVCRVSSETRQVGAFDGVPLYSTVFGEVVGLPEEAPGTLYIVSALVRGAVPGRKDVASPGELLRDGSGQPVGCRGLVVNT